MKKKRKVVDDFRQYLTAPNKRAIHMYNVKFKLDSEMN